MFQVLKGWKDGGPTHLNLSYEGGEGGQSKE